MIITHKIQCFPNQTQKSIIERTLGSCRWIYNRFLFLNIERYKRKEKYLSAYDFSELLTKYKKSDPEYMWLNEISQKAVKQAIIDADKSYIRFFKKSGGFPKFKSKRKNPVTSYYLYPVKGEYKHNKIKLPLLGWMRICENNYVIYSHIINARMIKDRLGKYFIQLSTEIEPEERIVYSYPIGIDVGIKNFLTISNKYYESYTIDSFLKNPYIIKLENKKTKLQQIISKKAEINYYRLLNNYMDSHNGEEPDKNYEKIMKGESYNSTGILKAQRKIIKSIKKSEIIRKI